MSSATLAKAQEYAANLTAADKAALLDFLLAKMENEMPPEIDALWREEIRRRAADLASGEDPGTPWEAVQANIKKKFGFS